FVPCRWEGEILERCSQGCTSKNVYECLCPQMNDAGPTRCTRGPNSGKDPDIASCTIGADSKRCRFYVPLEVVPPPARPPARPSPAPPAPSHPDSMNPGDGGPRHLCFHVSPVDNGVWRECVAALLPSLPLFNGRRLVAIMTEEPNAARRLDP